jgi:hypothetical protein
MFARASRNRPASQPASQPANPPKPQQSSETNTPGLGSRTPAGQTPIVFRNQQAGAGKRNTSRPAPEVNRPNRVDMGRNVRQPNPQVKPPEAPRPKRADLGRSVRQPDPPVKFPEVHRPERAGAGRWQPALASNDGQTSRKTQSWRKSVDNRANWQAKIT